MCSEDYTITCDVRTLINNGYVYLDTIRYLHLDLSYIREDTIANIVYIRYNYYCTGHLDTVDRVLYNYNWQVNDTIRQPDFCGDHPVCWVSAIDSTEINGIWYKVWHINGICGGDARPIAYNIIEGIGCTQAFDYAIRPYPPFENSEQIICFSNRGISYALSNTVWSWGLSGNIYFDNTTSCASHTIKVNGVQPINQSISVVPNPTTSSITISAPTTITQLIITNLLGQIVYIHEYNTSTTMVDLADLPVRGK